MKLQRLLAITVLLALGACAGQEMKTEEDTASGSDIWRDYTQEDADKAIAAAEVAIKRAASVDGEWRDTTKVYLKQAKDAAANGIFKIAVQLAETAQFQADMGYEQAMAQKDAKPWLF